MLAVASSVCGCVCDPLSDTHVVDLLIQLNIISKELCAIADYCYTASIYKHEACTLPAAGTYNTEEIAMQSLHDDQ